MVNSGDAQEWAFMLDAEPCDMCGHEQHGVTDCGEVVGYDHLNGDHECGCPGPLAEQLAQAWDEGHSAGWEDANDANRPQAMGSFNPYRGESHE